MDHQWTHTGEAPSRCLVCSKHYKANISLRSHVKLHT